MKRWRLVLMLFLIPFTMASANCDLTRFRWECDIPIHPKPARHDTSLVYCGHAYGYVTKADYQRLIRYQRADINMIATVHGEYVDSPCIPDRR